MSDEKARETRVIVLHPSQAADEKLVAALEACFPDARIITQGLMKDAPSMGERQASLPLKNPCS